MKSIVLSLPVMLLSVMSFAHAATLVETEDGRAGVQKMWIEGTKMRIQTGRDSEYMLADYAQKKILIIDPTKKEMIDVSAFIKGKAPNIQGLNVRVKHMGSGPTIAGYPTQKYALSVNGRTCNTTMVSAKALKDTKMGPLLESMTQIDLNPMGSQFMSECDRADLIFAKRLKKLGLPLGTLGKNGELRDKVKRIVKNAQPPVGGFKAPSGYRTVSMQQKMQEAFKGMPPGAAGQMTPEMEKMMQEMMQQQNR